MTTSHPKRVQTITNHQQTTTNYQQWRLQTTSKRPQTTNKQPHMVTLAHQTKELMFYFFFPNPVITRATQTLKNIGSRWGEIVSYFHSICEEQEKYGMLAFVGLENQLFFWLHLSTNKVVFWYFRNLRSVQMVFHMYIFYTLMQI